MTRLNRARPVSIVRLQGQRGFTLIEVIVTSVIIASIGVAIITSMSSQVVSAKKNQCMANLQMIESAKNAWVGDHPGQAMATPPFAAGTTDPLSEYMRGGGVPTTCPSNPAIGYTYAYDPAQPTYCPYHNQQSYPTTAATPAPTSSP